MNGEAAEPNALASHLGWLGGGEDPTILSEILLLLLAPAGIAGVFLGVSLICMMKWRSIRRIETSSEAHIADLFDGQ